jgi:hypothetical protein
MDPHTPHIAMVRREVSAYIAEYRALYGHPDLVIPDEYIEHQIKMVVNGMDDGPCPDHDDGSAYYRYCIMEFGTLFDDYYIGRTLADIAREEESLERMHV